MNEERIMMAHGSGGKASQGLIQDLFYQYFQNDILLQSNDASVLPPASGRIAVSTDSFVIQPIFFPGGDIGKLAVCGTINDVAMSGAVPLYITAAFIIEEGFLLKDLQRIVLSMAKTAHEAGVKIIAGDTKVVEKGAVDQIYINTTGIGIVPGHLHIGGQYARAGDQVLISGTIGDHGAAIMALRKGFDFASDLTSDCGLLSGLIKNIVDTGVEIKVLRDPTRGGVAATLNEIALQSQVSIQLEEEVLPIQEQVKSLGELLGLDPLYMANEGKLLVICPKEEAQRVLDIMKEHTIGKSGAIIGTVLESPKGEVYLKTALGGTRVLQMPQGELLPRIC